MAATLQMHGPSELRQGKPVFVALYPSGMQHDLGEVTLHSAEWLTPEDRPLCYFQPLKEEAFHSQDLRCITASTIKCVLVRFKKKKKAIF